MTLHTTTGIELFGDDLRIVVLAGLTRGVRVTKSVTIQGFGGGGSALDPASRIERLASAVRTYRIPTRNVHLVLPGSFGTVREIDVPSAVTGDLADVAALQLESVSPWPIEDIWWSAGGGDSRNSKLPIRKALLSVIPAEAARPWVDLFHQVGLPLASLSLAPAAWAEGLVRLFGTDRPSVALGVLEDRVEGVLVTRDRAMAATGTFGIGLGDRDPAVRRTLADLVGRARVEDPDTIRLVARGPIPDELHPLALGALPLNDGTNRAVENFGAIAAALARSANLIPPALREKREVARFVPTIALAACLLVAVTALLVREPYQYLRYSQRLDAEIARLAPLVDEVIAEDTELAAAREQFQILDAVIADDSNLEALMWLAGSMPLDTWITSYSSQGNVLTLSGYSAATSQFQLLLEGSDLFEGVELASPVTRDATNRERFTLRMRLAGVS